MRSYRSARLFMAATPPLGMLIASFLKLLGQDYPSPRDAKQRSLAPRVRKLSSDLDAINCVQPIGYDFAGRHPPSPDVRISRTTAVGSPLTVSFRNNVARKAQPCALDRAMLGLGRSLLCVEGWAQKASAAGGSDT
jgi:hypothetical protein